MKIWIKNLGENSPVHSVAPEVRLVTASLCMLQFSQLNFYMQIVRILRKIFAVLIIARLCRIFLAVFIRDVEITPVFNARWDFYSSKRNNDQARTYFLSLPVD